MIAAESLGNRNMNGDLMIGLSSGYMFYVLVVIVSFSFLSISRDTREKVCSCVF